MGLPYSYRQFYETEISPKKFFSKLTEKKEKYQLQNLNIDKNEIKFSFSPNFFGIKNTVLLDFKTDFTGFYYEFQLENLIRISLVFVIIFAFTLRGFVNLLIYPSLAIFLLYAVVVFQTKSFLETIFDDITMLGTKEEELTPEQEEWLKNSNLCPACGTELTEFDEFCPECKLNLKRYRKAKKQPVSRTGFDDFRIYYKYKST
jgi:rubredoxin